MQQYTRKNPPKVPSRLKLPSITGSSSQEAQSLVSQEILGRGTQSKSDDVSNNAGALSSPLFRHNSGKNRGSQQENITTSPEKQRKPLYLRMIAKEEKLLMEEE